jgi:hypothetical protein
MLIRLGLLKLRNQALTGFKLEGVSGCELLKRLSTHPAIRQHTIELSHKGAAPAAPLHAI